MEHVTLFSLNLVTLSDMELGVSCDTSYANLIIGVHNAQDQSYFLIRNNEKCPLTLESNKIC